MVSLAIADALPDLLGRRSLIDYQTFSILTTGYKYGGRVPQYYRGRDWALAPWIGQPNSISSTHLKGATISPGGWRQPGPDAMDLPDAGNDSTTSTWQRK